MSWLHLNLALIRSAVADLGDEFTSMDVAVQVRNAPAHAGLNTHRNFNAFVGRRLSVDASTLGIMFSRRTTAQGHSTAVWRKR